MTQPEKASGGKAASPRSAPGPQRQDFVAVGEIVRPQGLRGDAKVRLLCSGPDFLASCIDSGRLLLARGGPLAADVAPVDVAMVRSLGDFAVVRIAGVDSREEIEALRGGRIGLRQDDLPRLEEGEFYRFQLEGFDVFDLSGKRIGRVERVEENPAHDQIVVAPEGPEIKPFMIPLVERFVRLVDVGAGRIEVDLPDGLIESQQ